MGLQDTGVDVLAQMVRSKEFATHTEALETAGRWLMTAARNPRGKEVEVSMVNSNGGRCYTYGEIGHEWRDCQVVSKGRGRYGAWTDTGKGEWKGTRVKGADKGWT